LIIKADTATTIFNQIPWKHTTEIWGIH